MRDRCHGPYAWIALGSNLGDRLENLCQAVLALQTADPARLSVKQHSSVYESRALGPTQPNYYNAVVKVWTALAAHELWDLMQGIETGLGRVRHERWGPRLIDLDLLLHGSTDNHQVSSHYDGLIVPHPEMLHRDFVLEPLQEISPELEVVGSSIEAHLHALGPEARTLVGIIGGLG